MNSFNIAGISIETGIKTKKLLEYCRLHHIRYFVDEHNDVRVSPLYKDELFKYAYSLRPVVPGVRDAQGQDNG